MFGDLRAFSPDRSPQADWFRQLMDEFLPDTGAANIRSVPSGTFPMINVGRTDDALRVYVFAAGLSADDLDVSIQDNVLTISGKRESAIPGKEGEAQRTQFRRERYQGEFSRSLALPEGVDIERVEARFRNGVCEVVLPKREELKPRRIDIQAA